jgi:hypothetical protein
VPALTGADEPTAMPRRAATATAAVPCCGFGARELTSTDDGTDAERHALPAAGVFRHNTSLQLHDDVVIDSGS